MSNSNSNINFSSFDHVHSTSELKYSHVEFREYVFNSLEVYNEITLPIKDGGSVDIYLGYKSGSEYLHGDYSAPSNRLGDADSDTPLIAALIGCTESDLDDKEFVDELMAMADGIDVDAMGGLFSLYESLNQNYSDAEQYRHDLEISSNVNDYDFEKYGVDGCIIHV